MRNQFRLRFSVLTIMIVIALLAVGFACLRPSTLTADEAKRIATDRFQKTPGAEAWKGCPTRSAQTNRGHWCVDFINPATGQPLVQIMVDKSGKPSTAYIPVSGGRESIAVPETLPRIPPPQP
jgi:hypothetical protein